MISYDDFSIFKKQPSWVNWIVHALIYHLIVTIVFIAIGSNVVPTARLILTLVVVAGLPIAIVRFRGYFPEAFYSLGAVIQIPEDSSLWIGKKINAIFSLKNKSVFLTFLITDIVIMGVVISLNTPFTQAEIVWGILYLQPLVVIGGHAVHIVIRLVEFLHEIAHSKLCVPFSMPPNLTVQPIFRFFSQLSIVAFILYGAHYLSLIFTGYALSVPIMVWMSFIGFFPFILLTLSIFQIHVLMNRIKEFHLVRLSGEIRKVFDELQKTASQEIAETLEVLINVQKSLEGSRVWPISVEGSATLVITLIVPVAQLILAAL
ncbi:MAG: hypothetical protein ACXADH_15905 [Candidatus Kariarchaeaceae archaeon]|jgi:hypothetical protein